MRSRKRRGEASSLILATFLVAIAAPLFADRKISADEAVFLATANNEALKQSAIALEAKRRALGLAWNELVPSVSVGSGLGGSIASADTERAAANSASLAASVSLSVSLSLSSSLSESKKLLRLSYEGELISYEAARSKLELQVRKLVYAIMLDGGNLQVARQNLERSKQSHSETEKRYKAGLAPELDLLSAKANLAQTGPTVEAYANILANDLDSLKILVGLGSDEEVSIEGELKLDDGAITALLTNAKASQVSANHDVAAAAKNIEGAISTKATLERSKLWPSLALSASVAPSQPLAYSGTATSAGSVATTASAMVNIKLDNLLPGSAARQSIAEAQDSIDSRKIAYQSAVKSAEASRKSYARSVESYRTSLKALNLSAELAQQSYDASMKAYKGGLLTLTSLQSAEGDLESAKLAALSKSSELIAAVLDLVHETGLPLDSIGKE